MTTVFWTRDSWFIIYREDIYYWVRPWAPRILHSNLHSALNVVSGRHTSGSVSLVIRAQGEKLNQVVNSEGAQLKFPVPTFHL